MTDEDEPSEESPGFEDLRSHKEAHHPDEGFLLVEMDLVKPPVDLLSGLRESLVLSDISIPDTTELTDYVVYDADGNAYGEKTHDSLEARIDADRSHEFIDEVRADDIRTRRVALLGLSKVAEDDPEACLDAIPVLTSQLEASEIDIRASALDILARLAQAYPEQVTPATDTVCPFLEGDRHERLRTAAAQFVAAIADHDPTAVVDAVPTLVALLAETEEETPATSDALTALQRIGGAYPDAVIPAVPELRTYLEDGSVNQRVGAIGIIGVISVEYPNISEDLLPTISELVDAEHHMVRANAVGLLSEIANEYPDQVRPMVPRMVGLLGDTDENARYNATSVLARIAKTHPESLDGAVDPLIDALDEEFPWSRSNACWALGRIEAERALDTLEALAADDPHDEVQHAAEWAVQNIEDGP